MNLFYVSFADRGRAKGDRFLGACVVEGRDIREASERATALRIHPGGEILGVPVEPETAPLIDAKWKNRLLTREECAVMDEEICALMETKGLVEPFEPEFELLCPDHNPKWVD